MVDNVQQHVAACHRAGTAVYKFEINDFLVRGVCRRIGLGHVPLIETGLGGPQVR